MEEERAPAPTVSLVDGGIHIDFSGFWNRDIGEYNFFSMSRKRNFAGMAERSGEALAALLHDVDFAFGLAALRYAVSLPETDPDYVSEEALPTQVADLFNDHAVSIIGEIVDAAYEAEGIDIDTEHGGKNNEELQFTNEHALVILRWSLACVASAPIITVFMDEHDIQSRDSMNLIMGVFGALLYWKSGIDARQVRRLQVAAAGHDTLACLLRPAREQAESSPASLRLSLAAGAEDTLDVRLLKRRGPPCNRTLHLAFPRPLQRPLKWPLNSHEADEPRFPQDIQSAIPLARPASALPFARSQRPAAVA